MSRAHRLDRRVRQSLRHSQREAVASAIMSGALDNYLNAFAIHLRASAQQIGWLTAVPPLAGASMQLFAVWLGTFGVRRIHLIVGGALFQAAALAPLVLIAFVATEHAIAILLACAVLYQAGGNFVQPHWRALMGQLVPEERRGRFFGRRTRTVTIVSFAALVGGGVVLHATDAVELTWAGYGLLFLVAMSGRLASARLLGRMYDPHPAGELTGEHPVRGTLTICWHAMREPAFRRFTLFVACMQGAVAVTAPFFSVHMLRELHFSYVEFMANLAMSILIQFLTLNAWGHISDHLGNRMIMMTTSLLIPLLPALWMVSDGFWYLLGVQVVAGIAWGGFSLSTGNYLYDLRPRGSEFATYAALHAIASSCAVFVGAAFGGMIAARAPTEIHFGEYRFAWSHAMYGVFAVSALLRAIVAAWFLPQVAEIRVTRAASMRELIFRFARFNPISGVVIDLVAASRRRPRR
jgi:MFS family permease